MSSAPREMVNNLAQVEGEFAVLVETALSKQERRLDLGESTFYRLVFDPRCLTLRRINCRDILDIRSFVCEVIRERWVSDDHTHYGCLARLVRMTAGESATGQTVFDHVERQIRNLLAQHWYRRLTES